MQCQKSDSDLCNKHTQNTHLFIQVVPVDHVMNSLFIKSFEVIISKIVQTGTTFSDKNEHKSSPHQPKIAAIAVHKTEAMNCSTDKCLMDSNKVNSYNFYLQGITGSCSVLHHMYETTNAVFENDAGNIRTGKKV